MGKIFRDVTGVSLKTYDVIVIGGGIYGVMMMLEGVLRGQQVLLLEKNDFGGQTSFNNFRIIHGGLRYLQSLNLKRFYESVEAQRWFLRSFESFVKPIPCVMPLYGNGLKRPIILKTALLMNHLFSRTRNEGVPQKNWLPKGEVVNPARRTDFSDYIAEKGLQGCALWHDASMIDSHRILIETLLWACEKGGRALNYVRVDQILVAEKQVQGVAITDLLSGCHIEIKAKMVINAAGPWCESLLPKSERTTFSSFNKSLAWNILFDHPAISTCILAVSPSAQSGQTYFVQSWHSKLFVGTGHAIAKNEDTEAMPNETQLSEFISDIKAALPGLSLSRKHVLRVMAGFLPVVRPESTRLLTQAQITDHGKQGHLKGLFSVLGVKFTTAYSVAQQLFDRAGLGHRVVNPTFTPQLDYTFMQERIPGQAFTGGTLQKVIKQVIAEESVVHLTDLLFRRLNFMGEPELALKLAKQVGTTHFDWTPEQCEAEISAVTDWFHEGKYQFFDASRTEH